MNTNFIQLEKFLLSQGQKNKSHLLKNFTDFQLKVLLELTKIPPGQTRTYQEIASAVGRPKACRAVGSVCAKNPILITIPCHRVVCQNGSLGGYAGGVKQKKLLLQSEKSHALLST